MATPLVKLQRVTATATATPCASVYAKLECYSATGSNKDRVARRLLQDVAAAGATPPTTFVVPTSGNLGISVATHVVPKGHRVVVVVPEKTSGDKMAQLKALGAEIYRTSNRAHQDAPDSFVGLAKKIAAQTPDSVLINEFENEANALVHHDETAEEILQATGGKIDVVVVAAESCGTLVGVARKLKAKVPGVKVVGVDARGSALTSPDFHDVGSFRAEAIGNSFVPKILSSAEPALIDSWAVVTDKEAFTAARRLHREEGILAGSSSGAALVAALKEAAALPASATVVVVFADSARNYTSTLLNDTWLNMHGLLAKESKADRYRGAAVAELNLPTPTSIAPATTIEEAVQIMERDDFDQLPVLYNKKLVGYVSLGSLRPLVSGDDNKAIHTVDRWMHTFPKDKKFQTITPETPLAELDAFFDTHPVAFVTDSEAQWCLGVVTKADLLEYLERRG